MTREDITRWAREAEDYADTVYEKGEYHPGWVEVRDQRFAALAVAAEREACIRDVRAYGGIHIYDAGKIVEAIRARGSK